MKFPAPALRLAGGTRTRALRVVRWPKRHPVIAWVLASAVLGAGTATTLSANASRIVLDGWGAATALALIAWLTVALIRDRRAVLRAFLADRLRRALGAAALLLIAVGGTLYGIAHAQPGVTRPSLNAAGWVLVLLGVLVAVYWSHLRGGRWTRRTLSGAVNLLRAARHPVTGVRAAREAWMLSLTPQSARGGGGGVPRGRGRQKPGGKGRNAR